jgi:flagellar assembly protein FliH
MPSSSWRLIHDDGTLTRHGQSAADTAAIVPRPDSGTVLRGASRANSRAAGHAATGQAPMGAAQSPAAAAVEPTLTTEDVARIEREAEQRGYESGRARAEAELRGAVESASALADKLDAVAPERTSEIAHSIAELALSVAKRIIQHEVRIDPSLLCASLEAAVSTINGSPEAHVLLNPASVEPVAEAWEALHGRAYLGKKWFFEGDPTLPVGGCTLRYEHGFVEAGLESQLEEIGIALDRAIPSLARGSADEEVA